MFCSTIIPTINRPTLDRAVNSILNQDFDSEDFEVIVVNDSGLPLPEASWKNSEKVSILNTQKRERSIARNTGAAVARGRYLHFLDDDDWILPGALDHFWGLSNSTDAVWLYGSSQLVDRSGEPILQLHHGMSGNCLVQVMAGEWIPLQASLIDSKVFHSIGGYNPDITSTEDVDLCRRVALCGEFAEVQAVVACISMGEENSTTDYRTSSIQSRRAREDILNQAGVFSRMRDSAHSSSWRGRIVRIYLTSLVWNISHHRVFTAASRAVFAMAAMGISRMYLLSRDFWRAIIHAYQSDTFNREL